MQFDFIEIIELFNSINIVQYGSTLKLLFWIVNLTIFEEGFVNINSFL